MPSEPSREPRASLGEALAFLLMAALFVGLHFAWIDRNHHPLMDRSYEDLVHALDLSQDREAPNPYPPLVYVWTRVALDRVGWTVASAQRALALFTVPFLAGMWWWGRRFGGPWGGALLAAAAGGEIWFTLHARIYGVEVACTAFLALALGALAASRGFTRPVPTVAFGLAVGLGMLSKWLFLPFVLLPWVAVGSRAFRGGRASWVMLAVTVLGVGATMGFLSPLDARDHLPTWANGAVAGAWLLVLVGAFRARGLGAPGPGTWNPGAGVAVAILTCSWWYVGNFGELRLLATGDAGEAFAVRGNLELSARQLALSWTAAPAMVALSLAWSAWDRRVRWPVLLALSSAALGVWLVASSGPRWWPRYLLPSVPLLVFAGFAPLAAAAGRWGPRRRALALATVLGLSLVQVGSFLWERDRVVLDLYAPRGLWGAWPRALLPDPTVYPVEEALDLVPSGASGIGLCNLERADLIPTGMLEFLSRASGRTLRVEILLEGGKDDSFPPPPPVDHVLLVQPAWFGPDWVHRHLAWLERYHPVAHWAIRHPDNWCTYPWFLDGDCARGGHRVDLTLFRLEGTGEPPPRGTATRR